MSFELLTVQLRKLEEVLAEGRRDLEKWRKVLRSVARRMVDTIEEEFARSIAKMMPERITDERFSVAVEAVTQVSDIFARLKREVGGGNPMRAQQVVFELERAISRARNTLILLGAGAPMPLIFHVAPEFLRGAVRMPEEVQLLGSLAGQIHRIVSERRRISVSELARMLNITDENRSNFNSAVEELVRRGYVRLSVDGSGVVYLEPGW
ncbi:MAG: winged helix-turn-helix domain-containing protein [Thermofilaceae archaeon]